MKSALISILLLGAPGLASADDCSDVQNVIDQLKNSPESLAGAEQSMNEIDDVNHYYDATVVLFGARRCDIITDGGQPSLLRSPTIKYSCKWTLPSSEEAISTAGGMVETIEQCIGMEPRKIESRRDRNNAKYLFREEVSTSRGTAKLSVRVNGRGSRRDDRGELSMAISIAYAGDEEE